MERRLVKSECGFFYVAQIPKLRFMQIYRVEDRSNPLRRITDKNFVVLRSDCWWFEPKARSLVGPD